MTTSSTPTQTSGTSDLRPAEDCWPQAGDWHSTAPNRVIRAHRDGDLDEAWRKWANHMEGRKRPNGIHAQLKPRHAPLTWGLSARLADDQTRRLIELLDKPGKRTKTNWDDIADLLAPWLDEAPDAEINEQHALQCVAWARAIDRLVPKCPQSLWWELYQYLTRVADGARAIADESAPLTANLLASELPLTLSYLLPELKPCRQRAKAAAKRLSQSIRGLLDGQGMPHAHHLHLTRPLLACWTRCRAILDKMTKVAWSDDAEAQYAWLVTQALRLSHPDGSMMITGDTLDAATKELFTIAIQSGGDEADREIADHYLPGRSSKRTNEVEWPNPAYESEWSALAVLRDHWSKTPRQLLVTYPDRDTHIDLSVGSNLLLSGDWSFELSVGNHKITTPPDAEWEPVAWESDGDVDYIELECSVTPDLRLQRSFLLARKDRFLLLADAVLGTAPRPLQYNAQLTLAPGVTATAADKTREICLQNGAARARLLPLALPEWRSDPRCGSLIIDDRQLNLEQQGTGALFAPLFIDLDSGRHRKPLTWRPLTVAEMRKTLPRNMAAGFRVQIGKAQWLIYRSLTPTANRTLLGQNLNCEMHVSRFLTKGEVEELIEIE